MNRLQKIKNSFSTTKNLIDQIFLRNAFLENAKGIADDPYLKSDLVYVCISTTAKAIAQVPMVIKEKTPEGWVPVSDSDPHQMLLNNPNPLMPTSFEFLNALISHLLLDGHVWILPFPPNSPRPVSLWLLRKRNMEKILDDRTNQLVGWEYTPTKGKSIPLYADEVVSIKFFNPDDDVLGISPIEAGKLPINTDYKTAVYNEKFFDDGAVPGGIISTENRLTDTAIVRLEKQFEDKHSGYRKSHRLAILDSGLKYTQMGLSQKDMEFPELRRMNRESIMQIFGMKKIIISVTENLNYATAKVERQEWWQGTNLPLMNMISEGLARIFYKNIPTKTIIFDTSNVDALHEDFSTKVTTGEKLFKMGFSPNEINQRLNLGFEYKKWRDFWYVPSNVVRVNEDGTLDTTGSNPQLPGPDTTPPALPPPDDEEDEVVEDLVVPSITKGVEGFTTDEEILFGSEWKSLQSKRLGLEWDFEAKVRKIFFDMRKKSLRLLNQKGVNNIENEEFLEEQKALTIQTVSLYESAVKLGAMSIINGYSLDISFNINDPEIISFLTNKPIMVSRIVSTVKNQLRQQLIEGVTANESIEMIATRIKKVMSNAHKRAMTIAVTEVGSAVSFGRSMELRDAGFTKKKWYTALDERVRPSHQSMHGKVVEMGKPWIVGGATLYFPGDPSGPAREVINCRCIELPVKD